MASSRPTFDSLRISPKIGLGTLIFKEAQMVAPGGPEGIPPDPGQSPVTGNPDEMQAPESANQRQYEDDFGSLAFQFVQDRAPALIKYLIGFEVVDRSEDGSKAVGIFGYKIGDDFYYVPAFFLNNQVRGIDMILNKKTNQFVPLEEKWIDFIISRHSVSIGEAADDRVRETMRNPDLTFVQRPQVMLGKMGSAEEDALWTFSDAWEHIKEATAKALSDPDTAEMLAGLASSVVGKIEKCAESGYIRSFMEKVGGPECMVRFLGAMHDAGFANAALTLYKDAGAFWTDRLANASIHVDRMRKIAASSPKVRVVGDIGDLSKSAQDAPASEVGGEDRPLTVEENARQIVERDFTIEDLRQDEETAKVTDDDALVSFERRFNPPDGPGMYNFVMGDGMTREGLMLNAVVSPTCGGKDCTLFCFEDNGFVLAEASPMSVLTTEFKEDSAKDDKGDDLKSLYGKASDIGGIEVGTDGRDTGTPYLFIDDKGNAAGPFFIKHVFKDGDHTRFSTGWGECVIRTEPSDALEPHYGFMDWDMSDRYHDFDGRRKTWYNSDICCECELCGPSDFLSVGSEGGMPKKTSSGVIIPADWKALKVRALPEHSYNPDESEAERERSRNRAREERTALVGRYTFGRPGDILDQMKSEGVERIKIASDGSDFYFSVDGAKRPHGPMGYKQAAVDLVTRFGMRPRRAFSYLSKAAASSDGVRILVRVPSLSGKAGIGKSAQVGSLVNVAMPAPMDQIPATDPYSGVPVYASPYVEMVHGQFTGVPGLPPEGGMTRGINIGGEMERNMGGEEIPDEHTDSLEGALPLDEEAKALAAEAAAAGQRHVFDQAAIGGLVKVYDVANVVDSYVPEFMDTIDRLGRILFLFYWKHEDFNQRYGSDDVVQMEDRLRNVFKSLGELTLQLKEKTVQQD